LAFFQLLLGPADATFSRDLLFGILDPADKFVAGQGRDVLPGIECRGVGEQRLAQVCWKYVHHPTGHSRATHQGHGSESRRDRSSSKRLRSPPKRVRFSAPICRVFGDPAHPGDAHIGAPHVHRAGTVARPDQAHRALVDHPLWVSELASNATMSIIARRHRVAAGVERVLGVADRGDDHCDDGGGTDEYEAAQECPDHVSG